MRSARSSRMSGPPTGRGALSPPAEAELIAGVVARDLPFYDATISPAAIAGLNRFAQATGLLEQAVDYDALVATQFRLCRQHVKLSGLGSTSIDRFCCC